MSSRPLDLFSSIYCPLMKLREGNAFSCDYYSSYTGPHCARIPPTCSNLFNIDLTVQDPSPRPVQTCSLWTSPYRTPSGMYSNLFNLGLTLQERPFKPWPCRRTRTSYRQTFRTVVRWAVRILLECFLVE